MLKLIKEIVSATRSKKPEELNLNLGNTKIDENLVKVDFQIIDKYQSFSSEILRISLIGIGVYAFLLKDVNDVFQKISKSGNLKIFSIISIISFAIAVACTLVHRYYSSDFMAYHIRYLRLKQSLIDASLNLSEEIKEKIEEELKLEKSDRDVILQLCEVMIAGSAFFLGLGTICLAVSLLTIIFDNQSK